MSVAMMPGQIWPAGRMATALVHINTALAGLRRNPDGSVNDLTIEEARELKLQLEQYPSACTADALACCSKLLEARGT